MPILQKTDNIEIASVVTDDNFVEDMLDKEWLLTNSRGGYACSTIIGCNTRRYHGLLVGSLNPPAGRIMALVNCLETLKFASKTVELSTFEFSDRFVPTGYEYIKQFRQDIGVHFDYRSEDFELTKSVYLLRDVDTVGVVYDFTEVAQPAEFALRPFVGLRDFHSLQRSSAGLRARWFDNALAVRYDSPDSCGLVLKCPSANFEFDEQWWFDFVYRADKRRGQGFTEDLWTPGLFKCRLDSPTKIILWANFNGPVTGKTPDQCDEQSAINIDLDIETVREDLLKHQQDIIHNTKKPECDSLNPKRNLVLSLAADKFVMNRKSSREPYKRTTILAGFPWFADWGRDAFIALPGLLLCTGRYDEAKSILTSFAAAADDGLIPNRFDDYSDDACFNSIDASLWFINAAFEYLISSADSHTFAQQLLPTICMIAEAYHNGTKFDIHADADGLITGGNEQTQLTWMDARYEGRSFTPRYGKAVEINALWYNSLCRLEQFYAGDDREKAEYYKSMAAKVKAGFCELFWNETAGYLNDCILPDGTVDSTLRPNQIFAVSLPFSPLPPREQAMVVDVVWEHLLTPYGLRTLNTQDSRYRGVYTGPQSQRDEAYHQGTVWPYPMGHFVEAYLKVNQFSADSKAKAAGFIEPLMCHLTENGCLGQVSEIFDGDLPQKPKGCIAQAWSVAELLRVHPLIHP